MANRTDVAAHHIHGTDPQYLIEKITREKIYEQQYWKEKCFGLTAALIVDRAIELECISGCYGGTMKPSKFLCLLLKMLQIQPEREIILEFILNEDYPYVRLLGAVYLRLTGSSLDIYQYLEPLLADSRRVKTRTRDGKMCATHVDEIIDTLLTASAYIDITLPHLAKRTHLESLGKLDGPRKSPLEDLIREEEEVTAAAAVHKANRDGTDASEIPPASEDQIDLIEARQSRKVEAAQKARQAEREKRLGLPAGTSATAATTTGPTLEEGEAPMETDEIPPAAAAASSLTDQQPFASSPRDERDWERSRDRARDRDRDRDRDRHHSSSRRHRDDSRDRDRDRSRERRDRHRSSRDDNRERSHERSSHHRHRSRDRSHERSSHRHHDRSDRDHPSSSRHHHSSSSRSHRERRSRSKDRDTHSSRAADSTTHAPNPASSRKRARSDDAAN